MKVDGESILFRIDRLKRDLASLPEVPEQPEFPAEMRELLKLTPVVLTEIELSIRCGSPSEPLVDLEKIHQMLSLVESRVQWVKGAKGGERIADDVRNHREPAPVLPPDRRLLQRMTGFLMSRLDRSAFQNLAREWGGPGTVVGNTLRLDPGEVDAFSQWLLHDRVLPGHSKRPIELFSEELAGFLPSDERSVLDSWLADRPSIYRVVKIRPEETFLVRDLLEPEEVIRIQDQATSHALKKDDVFIGRAILQDESRKVYGLLGSILELPPPLWEKLSPFLEELSSQHFSRNPGATSQNFFRAHHARLRRKIWEIA